MRRWVPRLVRKALLVACALAGSASGFSNYSPGEVLPDANLRGLGGASAQPWLGKEKVQLFIFFTPGSTNSLLGLKAVAAVEKDFAGQPVRFVGLVSGTVPEADVKKAVADAGFSGPVLVDDGDALYGKLGTALTPVIGITDQKHTLLAYLPFNKLQYQDKARAWVRFALGELTQEQLQAVLSPPPTVDGGELAVANRYLKLAERQATSGNTEGALGSVRKSLEHAELAGARALLARLLATKGECSVAAREQQRALELDPENARAKEPLPDCKVPSAGSP